MSLPLTGRCPIRGCRGRVRGSAGAPGRMNEVAVASEGRETRRRCGRPRKHRDENSHQRSRAGIVEWGVRSRSTHRSFEQRGAGPVMIQTSSSQKLCRCSSASVMLVDDHPPKPSHSQSLVGSRGPAAGASDRGLEASVWGTHRGPARGSKLRIVSASGYLSCSANRATPVLWGYAPPPAVVRILWGDVS